MIISFQNVDSDPAMVEITIRTTDSKLIKALRQDLDVYTGLVQLGDHVFYVEYDVTRFSDRCRFRLSAGTESNKLQIIQKISKFTDARD